MRSRAVRLTSCIAAWLAIAAAVYFLFQTENQITQQLSSLRVFEQRAREVEATLSDLRAAQQAYVAEGQGLGFWIPKVAALTESATTAVAAMRQAPIGARARTALGEAASTLTEFGAVDKRARDYLKSGQQLMAGDVVFTEGGEAAASASRQVEAARIAEQQAFDVAEAGLRKQQAIVGGAAAAIVAIALLLLLPLPRDTTEAAASIEESGRTIAPPVVAPVETAVAPAAAAAPPVAEPVEAAAPRPSPVLKATADLATDFGRVRDLDDLARLLGRAADVMDASGVVVWMGNTSGADLRPVLAHGYSARDVARMPAVPRSGDNAAAAAYRTGTLQIVLSRPGDSAGAIVAPILGPDGCIGALSAEIRRGGETSEGVQAMATIFAAQLAAVLPTASDDTGAKTAAQG